MLRSYEPESEAEAPDELGVHASAFAFFHRLHELLGPGLRDGAEAVMLGALRRHASLSAVQEQACGALCAACAKNAARFS